MLKQVAACVFVACGFADGAHAGAWEDGVAAYTHGDYAQAVAFMETAAEQGDADAQYNLGIAYANGVGTNRDYVASIKWFRRAADQGAAPAQFNLGVIYQRGLGVPQDYVESAKWYLLAAQAGEPRAQFEIGLKLADGQGIPRDLVHAHMWLSLAAAQGEANAAMHRDIVARLISADQLYEARQLAGSWHARQ